MLTELCADTRVDIQLRLQALEVVELRSRGWRRSSEITNYYSQRSQQARSHNSAGRAASLVSSRREDVVVASGREDVVASGKEDVASGVEGDGYRVYLECEDEELKAVAKAVLTDHFATGKSKMKVDLETSSSQSGREEVARAGDRRPARFLDR